jgi:hypothetical protein
MSMRIHRLIGIGVLVAGLCATTGSAAIAQHPTDGMEFMFANLRPAGQPVIPIFDGWYPNPDGTFTLCFGYFNLNTKQALDIPLGPNNFVEPKQYDGRQPTHFNPVPPPPNLYRRYFCVFPVTVPEGFGKTARVVWTLNVGGKAYSVPGHLGSINYKVQELSAKEGGRSSVAPVLKYLPSGPEGKGRNGVRTTMTAKVGTPLPLNVSVTGPPAGPQASDPDVSDVFHEERPYISNGKKRIWWVIWAKHQGPGEVSFAPQSIDIWEGETSAATSATFSKPGEYVLSVQAIDNPGEDASYQFHCCWTNGFVKVAVSE